MDATTATQATAHRSAEAEILAFAAACAACDTSDDDALVLRAEDWAELFRRIRAHCARAHRRHG